MSQPRLVFLLVPTFLLLGAAAARAQTAVPHRALTAVRTPAAAHLRPPAPTRPFRFAFASSLDSPPGRRAGMRLSLRPSDWLTGAAGVTWGPHGLLGLLGRLEFRFPAF